MPLYDFECDSCGARSEEIVHHSTVALPCKCGGQLLRRFSPPTRCRARDQYQGYYDPRDDSALIYNLDQAGKACGLPGYEPRRSR